MSMNQKYSQVPAILISLLLVYATWVHGDVDSRKTDASGSYEPPIMALKLFADARIDKCPICAENLLKKGISLFSREFPPGRKFAAGTSCGFEVLGDEKRNELVLSCMKKRAFYKKDEGGNELFFPLIVFRYHTEGQQMVGIDRAYLTSRENREIILKKERNSGFRGSILIVPYRYGDGRTFIFEKKENRLVVHCKILEVP